MSDAEPQPLDDPEDRTLDPNIKALMMILLLHSSQQNQTILNQLVLSYRRQVYELTAELHIVRADITRALESPYMPNPRALVILLDPDQSRVDLLANHYQEAAEI